MILKDIEIHTDQTDIQVIVGNGWFHLCDLFVRQLGDLKTPATKKVVIMLQKEGVDLFVKKERNKAFVLLDIIEYYKDFDHRAYEQGDIPEKKLMIWNAIYDSLFSIARQLNWDKEQVQRAYQQGLNLSLENKRVLVENLPSKDKKFYATLSIDFDFYSFKVFLDIRNADDKIICSKKVIDREPGWGWNDFPVFKFYKWTSDLEFSFGRTKDDPDSIRTKVG